MNIVKLQEFLKDFPADRLKAAANGQISSIPPLLAEMEMNRRSRIQAQASQPPTESVKDKLEQQLEPQGIQQAMPQGQPQGQPQAQQMAGVAGLPTGEMFKGFNNGGIVAFEEGGDVQKQAEIAAKALAYAPFIKEAGAAIKTMQDSAKVEEPEVHHKRQADFYAALGIRPPKEEELARVEESKKAYDADKEARERLQASKILAAASRPNVHGKYMFGTMGEEGATYGLANLEADRKFREENEKAKVAAKEAQREFALGNADKALAAKQKQEEYQREANKAAVTAYGTLGAHGLGALERQTSTQLTVGEQRRYHDMWNNMEDKKLKADYAKTAASLQMNAPELLKVVDGIKQRMPKLASEMTDEQLINYAAGKIAESRGAEDRAESSYNRDVRQRDEKIAAAINALPSVLTARQALEKAVKSGSRVDIDQAERNLIDVMARERRLQEATMTPLIKPTRPGVGIASPAAPPNPDENKNIAGTYDVKGNRIVKPSPVPEK